MNRRTAVKKPNVQTSPTTGPGLGSMFLRWWMIISGFLTPFSHAVKDLLVLPEEALTKETDWRTHG